MGAVDPTGGFAQALARLFSFALEEPDLTVRLNGGRITKTSRPCQGIAQAPVAGPVLRALRDQCCGDIKANAPRADHSNALPKGAAHQHLGVVGGVLGALKIKTARDKAGGQNDLVKAAQGFGGGALA